MHAGERTNGIRIAGVGASAGGLEAISDLLKGLPPEPNLAIVVVQHLEPHRESHLAEILAQSSQMPVEQVMDGTRVERNRVYVIPPNTAIAVREGVLHLSPRDQNASPHHPIDAFFRSLAQDQGERAVAVVLSGTASDGSEGLRAVKAAGGITFSQDEASAKYGGMPHSAAMTGAVDFVLPPGEIARGLSEVAQARLEPARAGPPEPEEELLQRILSIVAAEGRVNFGDYKENTVRRRIQRRMALHGAGSLAEYVELLETQPREAGELFRDMLINVTSFFREPEVFAELSRQIGAYVEGRNADDPFRVWVAGCSTGEEAYSTAIVVLEALERVSKPRRVQIIATDVSEAAIDKARAGLYPAAIEQEVSRKRLDRHFTRVDSGYRISQAIRDRCIFARHDLTADAPFSRLDLVVCRNVLIYIAAHAQRRIMPLLHYSLNPGGILVLGSAETAEGPGDLFAPLNAEHKIFARRAAPASPASVFGFPQHRQKAESSQPRVPGRTGLLSAGSLEITALRILRNLYAPPGVLVTGDLEILHFHGQTSPFLQASPQGDASLHLLRLVNEALVYPVRRAVDLAAAGNEPVRESGIWIVHEGRRREIQLHVIPVSHAETRCFLVLFEAREEEPAAAVSEAEGGQAGPVAALRAELAEARDYLRKITEQHEAATEELRAANEEAQSANEELQSANEELRTAKEEVQSSNEELISVNEELSHRNAEISIVSNDLSNVLNAVNIPILMCGMDMRLRRFTPAAERLLNLSSADVGREVRTMPLNFPGVPVAEMLAAAIRTLAVQEQGATDADGCRYQVIARPYRTLDDRIDGAVAAFIDTNALTRALESAEIARDFAEAIVETVRHPLLVLDADLRIQRATSAFYRTFHLTPAQANGQLLHEIGGGQWDLPELRSLLDQALARDVPFRDLEVEQEILGVGRRTMRLNARRIVGRDPKRSEVLLAIEDVTDRKEAAGIRYRRLFESARDLIVLLDADTGEVIDANPRFCEVTGYEKSTLLGRSFADIAPFAGPGQAAGVLDLVSWEEEARYDSVIRTRDGRELVVSVIGNQYRIQGKRCVQLNIRDVTEERRSQDQLRRYNLDLQQFAFAASHDLQEPLRTVTVYLQLLRRDLSASLDENTTGYLDHVVAAAERMRHMVLDLLAYSQVAHEEIKPGPANSEAVLASAIMNLQIAIQSAGAAITFDPLPTVAMDRTLLLQLLQNLIGNAIKYRGPDPPAIHISARAAGPEWILSVRDNGIGIDPRYSEHIFTVFKRLHGREFPGTGIGLSIAKRIVERHGGRIWVESEPGKGSTFFFTAPNAAPAPIAPGPGTPS
ncbi:MAG: PAS domain S-box protein [Bryobacteraceae bacterium]|nr:PAS domain S-box protein [Bryobacteraceae bacterium]